MRVHTIKTPKLNLVYEESGPKRGEPLLLVHGWPDSPRTWDKVLPALHDAGYRTLAPYLRGYGPSRFRDPLLGRRVPRTGQPVAFAEDMIALADRLGMKRFHFIGHDWGARTAYVLAALHPARLKSITAIAVAFEPGKAKFPGFAQAQHYWYQWLLCTRPGGKVFRESPVEFGRAQWDAWSPKGWYTEKEFAETARSWTSPDFADVVLHSYRSRWGHAELDPAYARQQAKLEGVSKLYTPTLMLQGTADTCGLPESSEGAERYFGGPYRRVLAEGAGHFVQRESPGGTAAVILEHLKAFR